jgi:hypothetical protein
MVPGVGRGHNRENHIYICLYRKKNLLLNQQANFNQTWYKSSLGKGNSKLYKLRARSFSKREIITKMGWGHLKIFFSQTTEPEELIFT